jgi:Mannosyl-glycoprotein endo-beta-N-acetylglucosaminidase
MSVAVNLTPDQSEQIIYSELVSAGIPPALAVLVTAQSGHETGGWSSHVYLTDNNAFGYGYTGSSYKQYSSVEASADDLADYLARRENDGSFPALDTITDPDQYATLLKSAGYYTDSESNYQAGIMNYLNNALSSVTQTVAQNPIPSGIVAVFVIFAFAFIFSRKGK